MRRVNHSAAAGCTGSRENEDVRENESWRACCGYEASVLRDTIEVSIPTDNDVESKRSEKGSKLKGGLKGKESRAAEVRV